MILFIIELYFLIPALIAKNFNATAEPEMSVGILTKKAEAEMETHLVTVEVKMSDCSI